MDRRPAPERGDDTVDEPVRLDLHHDQVPDPRQAGAPRPAQFPVPVMTREVDQTLPGRYRFEMRSILVEME